MLVLLLKDLREQEMKDFGESMFVPRGMRNENLMGIPGFPLQSLARSYDKAKLAILTLVVRMALNLSRTSSKDDFWSTE